MSREKRNPYEYCKEHRTISVKTTVGCPFCIAAKLTTAKENINHLIAGIDTVNNEGVKLRRENERLRDRVQEASRIVEKYRDACVEWAKESHHRGNRDDKIFWERRAKSMAVLIEDIKKELKGD